MTNAFIFSAIGLLTGVLSGLIGIGGAAVVIPILVYFFKFSQHSAQGTTLAMMVPPIGLLAAYAYYKAGYVDIKIAAALAVGFLIGGYLGGRFATAMPGYILKKIFGLFLLMVSLRMIIGR